MYRLLCRAGTVVLAGFLASLPCSSAVRAGFAQVPGTSRGITVQAPGRSSGVIVQVPGTSANVTVQAPRGWSRLTQPHSHMLVLVPPHLSAGEACTISVWPAQTLRGSFRAWFVAALRRSLGTEERIIKVGGVTAQRTSAGYDLLTTLTVVATRTGRRAIRLYVGLRSGRAVDVVVYAATSQSLYNRYQPVLGAFVGALRLGAASQRMTMSGTVPVQGHKKVAHPVKAPPAGAPAAPAQPTTTSAPPAATSTPLPPTATATPTGTPTMTPTSTPLPTATATPTNTALPPTATATPTSTPLPPTATATAVPPITAGPAGLYVNTTSIFQFNPVTNQWEYIIRRTYYLFTGNGWVHYGLPLGGLSSFDFTQALQSDPANTGTYVIMGSQILFNWGDGHSSMLAFSGSGSRLQIGSLVYDRVGTFDGLQLDGTYYASSFLNTSAGGNTGGVASSTTITFTVDGQFSTDNYSGFAGSGGTASTQSTASGTYSISGDTLDLLFSDGTDVKLTFFVYPGYENGSHPGFLIVNGVPFSPQG